MQRSFEGPENMTQETYSYAEVHTSVEQQNFSLSAFSLLLVIAQVWISEFSAQDVKSICWSADDKCQRSLGASGPCGDKHSDEAFPKIPQHSATINRYRGNQIGWDRLESDSEGLTWQVKGTDGSASSTQLYVESHETLTHPWDEVNSVSGVQKRRKGTRRTFYHSFLGTLLIYSDLQSSL